MALSGTFEVGNKSYKIFECDFEFTQDTDDTGRPSSNPGGGKINLTLDVHDDSDFMLHEWMKDTNMVKDGKLALTVNANNVEKKKTVKFKDAYCIYLYEYFNFSNIESNVPMMYMKISIIPETITFGDNDNCAFEGLIS
jgi:hypothetical protein